MSELTSETLVESKRMAVITLDLLKQFAQASGDHNPIHQDETVAKSMGLPGVIAHGMLIASFVHTRALQAMFSDKPLWGTKILTSQTRFKAMTFLGDEIHVGGYWQIATPTETKMLLEAKNQRGETVVVVSLLLQRES